MNMLYEWIVVGAGLAIGKLIVALGVIFVVVAVLALLFILEEKSK